MLHLNLGGKTRTSNATRQGDSVPEGTYWNWESGIRDHQGDVDTMRMF